MGGLRKHVSLILPALLSLASSGCAATAAGLTDAKAQFDTGMTLALKGDMKAALPHFARIEPDGLSPKQRTALAGVRANFDVKVSQDTRPDLDAWTAKVLDAYRAYWSGVMMGSVTAEAGERRLAQTLATLVGAAGGDATPVDMAALEPRLEEQLRARGYFSLHGVTSPFREFMLWRTRLDQTYQVELPGGNEGVSVAMLDDFISLGWTGFATGNYYHTAGWATRERLFCVRTAYDLDSESFRIGYLAHEGQHFSDYKRFPKLEGPELEYRAKLVEIAQADTTLRTLLKTFGSNGSDSRGHPHGHANRRLMSDLARTLKVAAPQDAWWESIPPPAIRAAASRLFNEDSRALLAMPRADSSQASAGRTVDAASIGRAVNAWRRQHGAPALSVAVALDGQPAWSGGFGLANPARGVLATSRTSYRLASVTKSITATAVMMLAEKGDLDLDAPIQRYCPAYPAKPWPITARLLLAHLAGVRHHGLFEVIWPNTRHFGSVASSLERFKDDELLAEPGTRYRYSSPGYTILGCAIEGAAGASYANFVAKHIFAPAGMSDTMPEAAQASADDETAYFSKGLIFKATGWFARRTTAQAIDVSDRLPAGGLVSTVDDMVRFAIAVQYGRLVSEEAREQMWTLQRTSDGKPLQFYGLGWLVAEADAQRPKRVWNDGSQPGTRSFLYLRPTEGIIIALMTNMEGAFAEELIPGILEAIVPCPGGTGCVALSKVVIQQ